MNEAFLRDLCVLDLSQGIAGPLTAKLMADQGARAIKVEPPEGDYSRRRGPFASGAPHPDNGLAFAFYNTNKVGVTLNIRTHEGAEILSQMVKRADILVEDLPPGEMDSLGLGYEGLALLNPSLIMVSVTPFGQTGPYRHYAAEDINLQAIGGFMYLSGDPDAPPVQVALEQAQIMGGRCAAMAAMMALMERLQSGEGQHVDVSIAEAVISQPPMHITQYSYLGAVPTRGPRRPAPTEGDYVPCKDGYICLTSGGGNHWDKFAAFFGAPELLDDEGDRFATRAGRNRHALELQQIVTTFLKDRNKFDVFHSAMRERFVFGVVQTPEELLECPQLREREHFREVSHPTLGTLQYPGPGFRVDGRPPGDIRPAPLLGQHNREIYCDWLGLPEESLGRLRAEGII